MAIMIKVHKRGTNLKEDFRNGVKSATKKLRRWLIASSIVNIITIGYIVLQIIKN